MEGNGKSVPIHDKLVRPVYPYWTLGYVITPKVAEILCNDAIKQNIIPVDEYLPTMMPLMKVAAYKENVVTPVSREVLGSNILSRSRYDLFVDGNIHLCTVATDEKKDTN